MTARLESTDHSLAVPILMAPGRAHLLAVLKQVESIGHFILATSVAECRDRIENVWHVLIVHNEALDNLCIKSAFASLSSPEQKRGQSSLPTIEPDWIVQMPEWIFAYMICKPFIDSSDQSISIGHTGISE